MSLLANSNAIESGGYNIDRSLRFRSSASAYLSRTPASATNRQTWTWAGWVKRGVIGSADQVLFAAGPDGVDFALMFPTADAGAGADNSLAFFQYSAGFVWQKTTSQLFRDPSSWYHIVAVLDTTNATAEDRARIYVNGTRVTSWQISTNPSLNYNSTQVNNNTAHRIGQTTSANSRYFDGYLAEVNFIDGQALTPSSFGQTDAVTGVWTPKKYTGTYGTNGFYLDFKTNTSPTTLAQDKSGNGNNWTANNISTTAGATYDSMTDVPTLTSATAANYCVWNPINKHSSVVVQDGNLTINTGTTGEGTLGTIGVSSGKWYFEFVAGATTGGWPKFGIAPVTADATQTNGVFNTGYAYAANGTKRSPGSDVSYAASYGSGDIIGMALDMDAGTLTFYKNNVSQGTAFTGLSGTFSPAIMVYGGSYINFGQRPFSYTPPTGFKALNTFNLPDPTIKKPNQYMDAKLDTGANIKGTAESTFTGDDLIWIKDRANANNHQLIDTVRGSTAVLQSNTTAAETTYSTPSGNSVAWCWKESATSGFDIVTYTGNGSNQTIAHSLGVSPKLIICKQRNSSADGWGVMHTSANNNTGWTGYLQLNTTGAFVANVNAWYNTAPTSSVFSVGPNGLSNAGSTTYVAYLFAEIPQFSKAFSFTGNASTDGSFVYLGFKPKAVLLKCSSTTGNWYLFDTVRNTYNVLGEQVYPNLSNAGSTITTLDALSNGFKMRLTGDPNAAQTYIGFAWADSPSKYSNAF